jgi:hypothetical protein
VFVTKKGSKSSIKPQEIWFDEDNAIFLKYCGEDPRLRFYHAVAMDTSGRPHELLQLKIGDIEIKKDVNGKLYVPLEIGRYGKKKKGRRVGMTDSIKYYRTWLQHHPDAGNPNAYVFVSKEFSAKYRNAPISVDSVRRDYVNFRDKHIPILLNKPDIPPEDKIKLQQMREQKRFHPYIVRHSSITKLAKNPQINEYRLRLHAGWTKTSNMIEVYTHELAGEHFEDIMLACGINLRDRNQQDQLHQQLQGKKCPYCSIENVPEAKFCISCKFTLDQISSQEVIEGVERSKRESEEVMKKIEQVEADLDQNMRESFENDVELKNFIVDMAKVLVAMEGPRKSMEKLDKKINEYEMEIAAIHEERKRLAEQQS